MVSFLIEEYIFIVSCCNWCIERNCWIPHLLLEGAKTLLTDTQLLTLAGKLGKEWIKIAIVNLELDISDIDAIREKEEDVTVYKFQMLKKWQEKEQNNATVQNLYNCLEKVSVEIRDVLEGKQKINLSRLLGIKLYLSE